ncbi:MAG: tRNA pseudouridine(55) synthase TruB [Patescibacteria group bacterium]
MKKILAIYKAKGPTSHDVVDKLRRITGIKKIGHAGTLDPLATGVLVVGIGREATKQLDTIVKSEKEYLATIKFGEESTTDDEEGEKRTIEFAAKPKREKIEQALREFIGIIDQVPPQYSAVKVKGRSAYKYARQGQKIELAAKQVEIKSIELIAYQWPILKLKVVTGKGVYIRSLGRDLGQKLGCGGYLADLERTRVGEYSKERSLTLEQFEKNR